VRKSRTQIKQSAQPANTSRQSFPPGNKADDKSPWLENEHTCTLYIQLYSKGKKNRFASFHNDVNRWKNPLSLPSTR